MYKAKEQIVSFFDVWKEGEILHQDAQPPEGKREAYTGVFEGDGAGQRSKRAAACGDFQ